MRSSSLASSMPPGSGHESRRSARRCGRNRIAGAAAGRTCGNRPVERGATVPLIRLNAAAAQTLRGPGDHSSDFLLNGWNGTIKWTEYVRIAAPGKCALAEARVVSHPREPTLGPARTCMAGLVWQRSGWSRLREVDNQVVAGWCKCGVHSHAKVGFGREAEALRQEQTRARQPTHHGPDRYRRRFRGFPVAELLDADEHQNDAQLLRQPKDLLLGSDEEKLRLRLRLLDLGLPRLRAISVFLPNPSRAQFVQPDRLDHAEHPAIQTRVRIPLIESTEGPLACGLQHVVGFGPGSRQGEGKAVAPWQDHRQLPPKLSLRSLCRRADAHASTRPFLARSNGTNIQANKLFNARCHPFSWSRNRPTRRISCCSSYVDGGKIATEAGPAAWIYHGSLRGTAMLIPWFNNIVMLMWYTKV